MTPTPNRPTWLGSDRFVAREIARPIQRFLHIEASGGLILVGAAVVALVWANSPWGASYDALWDTHLVIELGGRALEEDLRHWVNDGLMAIFFFVIGLEIKAELVDGQLREPRRAAIPIAGALGGMIVPAVLYLAISGGGQAGHGWGIPMATDVAFALGALALLGSRVPGELKVMLLGLAIVDDIGAILVIALFYSEGFEPGWALAAAGGVALMAVIKAVRVRYLPVYVVLGAGIWLATLESGVHATIAGVVLGLMTPAKPFLPLGDADRIADRLSFDTNVTAEEVRDISFQIREAVPPTERLQNLLHPWSSYLIVPIFALANAGIDVSGSRLTDAATEPVTLAVIMGLVVGKTTGVAGAIFLAARLGIGRLPDGVNRQHVVGMAALAGIGFTVSIFVAGLAFTDEVITENAKLGVLAASVIAAIVGTILLRRTAPKPAATEPAPVDVNPTLT